MCGCALRLDANQSGFFFFAEIFFGNFGRGTQPLRKDTEQAAAKFLTKSIMSRIRPCGMITSARSPSEHFFYDKNLYFSFQTRWGTKRNPCPIWYCGIPFGRLNIQLFNSEISQFGFLLEKLLPSCLRLLCCGCCFLTASLIEYSKSSKFARDWNNELF